MCGTKAFKILQFILLYLSVCQAEINLTEYLRMPALYNFDNYRECINRDEIAPKYPAKYCMVFVQFQPNNDSVAWQQMATIITDKFYYRHDLAFRGLCMARCKDLLENKRPDGNSDHEILTNVQTQYFQKFYSTNLDRTMRYRYQKDIHECVNREYMKNYNLSTKTFVNFCIDPRESKEKDIYFSLTVLVIMAVVLINILSTIYDAKLKPQQSSPKDKDNYYEVKHDGTVNRYLTAFSLYRNYKRLVLPTKGDIGSDLSFLDGFRTILSVLIILEHGCLLVYYHVENTESYENSWRQLPVKLFVHCFIWLELFFVLSGLLLYVKFEKSQYITAKSSFRDCIRVFARLIFSRYLRYLPSLLFVIFFTANINPYYGNNSLARSFIDAVCFNCRDSWWRNILMIHNSFMEEMCLIHTWYIAAEFQLYGFFLIILILTAKYPKFKIAAFISVAILAAAINFGVNYILKLESIFMLLPESLRYFYLHNTLSPKHMYFSSYTNINSFLLGILCGYIYMKYLRKSPENKKQLGAILQRYTYLGWIVIFGILYLGTTIMDHKETTVWTAAYGLLHRHVGLAIVAVVVILRGMCNEGGFLKNSNFRVMARISFQVYLWQMSVFLNILPYFIQPINMSFILAHMFAAFVYVSTALIAFLAALFVEYPFAEVINIADIEKKIKQVKTSDGK